MGDHRSPLRSGQKIFCLYAVQVAIKDYLPTRKDRWLAVSFVVGGGIDSPCGFYYKSRNSILPPSSPVATALTAAILPPTIT